MVGEKASPAKKPTRLRPTLFAVVALITVERRAFNSLAVILLLLRSVGVPPQREHLLTRKPHFAARLAARQAQHARAPDR